MKLRRIHPGDFLNIQASSGWILYLVGIPQDNAQVQLTAMVQENILRFECCEGPAIAIMNRFLKKYSGGGSYN